LIKISLYGRGGQGAVTAANLLVDAFYREGKNSQALPVFGVERRGAPVTAFVRIDERPIRLGCLVYEPDCIVVLDATLPRYVDVEKGLKEKGVAILNDVKSPSDVKTRTKLSKIATVDATSIAIEVFGRTSLPITNTAMLGAFSAATSWVSLESILDVLNERFRGEILIKNIEAVKKGYNLTRVKYFRGKR